MFIRLKKLSETSAFFINSYFEIDKVIDHVCLTRMLYLVGRTQFLKVGA